MFKVDSKSMTTRHLPVQVQQMETPEHYVKYVQR